MNQLETIKKNFEEYFEIAEYSFSNQKYNSAVTLYYKALVELCDYELFSKLGKIGANHNERFEVLKKHNLQLYTIASKLFTFYRDSYNKQISVTIAALVKKAVEDARKTIFG